jgi:hypothetical protein
LRSESVDNLFLKVVTAMDMEEMEEKDLESIKKANDEERSDLEDLGEEEVAQAVEGLKIGQGEIGDNLSIMHDANMEAELKEMFRDIVSQYITPVGKSVRALVNGDLSEHNIDICIGALKPLILASEEIHYNDIFDVLKSIEQPLVAFRKGKKRLLSKKDIRNISTDYKELVRLISRSVGSETVESNSTGIGRNTTATNFAIPAVESPADLHVSDMLPFFKDINPRDIQRLYAAGLIRLGAITTATAQEISESTGIGLPEAEKIRQCSLSAILSATTSQPVPKMEMQSSQQAGRYDLEEDDPTTAFTNSKQRWLMALETLMAEMSQYYQSTIALSNELERTHRALVSMRVARERFKGEVEFYHDDLVDMFETTEKLNEELGTPTTAHRQLLKNLRRIIDVVSSSLKKTEVIYGQLDDTLEDAQDAEAQLIALRRRKGAAPKGSGLRRRNNSDSIDENEGGDERLPRRLN